MTNLISCSCNLHIQDDPKADTPKHEAHCFTTLFMPHSTKHKRANLLRVHNTCAAFGKASHMHWLACHVTGLAT